MDITALCPDLLNERIAVEAKAGTALIFHPRILHGASDNQSSVPHLRCYPQLHVLDALHNTREEVLRTYLTGAHPKKYSHFFTGNKYKQKVIFARSARKHYQYPVNHIGAALIGIREWADREVQYNLCALFNKQLQETYITNWIEEFQSSWKALVELQIAENEPMYYNK